MAPRIVIIEELGPDADIERATAAALGVDVEARPSADRASRLHAARDADAIMLRLAQIDEDFIDQCPNLKVIGRCGVGTDNIDIDAATRRGIQVVNVPDYCIEEVATHTATLLLAAWRHIPLSMTLGAQDRWWDWDAVSPTRPLSQCRLGVVGLGRIGRSVVGMVGAWFEEVLFFDPVVTEAPPGLRSVGLDELFAECDIVTLHCPSTPETRGLVNAQRLALMRPDSLLINVARGDLIDEVALLTSLDEGRPSRAALDVLAAEPPAITNPLLHHPAVIVTNHMAWLSTEADAKVRTLITRRCALALVGEDAETIVNRQALALRG